MDDRHTYAAAGAVASLALGIAAVAAAGSDGLPAPGHAVPTGFSAAPMSVLVAGLVFGLRHALEADHLAAVAAMISERSGPCRASRIGLAWGLGHTAALLAVAAAIVLFDVRLGVRTTRLLDLAVAAMLVALGARVLWQLRRGARLHVHPHAHGGHVHVHPHVHPAGSREHDHAGEARPQTPRHHSHRSRPGVRPLLVGMVHGLAGSAALMLLVLSTIPSPLLGLAYVAAFGVGSIGGMICMSLLVSLPMSWARLRFREAHAAMSTLAGLTSVVLGLAMAYGGWPP